MGLYRGTNPRRGLGGDDSKALLGVLRTNDFRIQVDSVWECVTKVVRRLDPSLLRHTVRVILTHTPTFTSSLSAKGPWF